MPGQFDHRRKNSPFYERRRYNGDFSRIFILSFLFLGEANMSTTEGAFQADLIKDIYKRFEGSLVMKLDANYIQGIPDLLILYKDRWAILECKKSKKAHKQPNQEYYVNRLNNMSFSAIIYPENKETVLNEMERSFRTRRKTRNSKPE